MAVHTASQGTSVVTDMRGHCSSSADNFMEVSNITYAYADPGGPYGLKLRSAAAALPGSHVRILLRAQMFVCCVCCVLCR